MFFLAKRKLRERKKQDCTPPLAKEPSAECTSPVSKDERFCSCLSSKIEWVDGELRKEKGELINYSVLGHVRTYLSLLEYLPLTRNRNDQMEEIIISSSFPAKSV